MFHLAQQLYAHPKKSSGPMRTALVLGESGAGKTRLLECLKPPGPVDLDTRLSKIKPTMGQNKLVLSHKKWKLKLLDLGGAAAELYENYLGDASIVVFVANGSLESSLEHQFATMETQLRDAHDIALVVVLSQVQNQDQDPDQDPDCVVEAKSRASALAASIDARALFVVQWLDTDVSEVLKVLDKCVLLMKR